LIQVIEDCCAFDQCLTVVEQESRHSADGAELAKFRRLRKRRERQMLVRLAQNVQRDPDPADIWGIVATDEFHANHSSLPAGRTEAAANNMTFAFGPRNPASADVLLFASQATGRGVTRSSRSSNRLKAAPRQ
jgi:hypothetical protein